MSLIFSDEEYTLFRDLISQTAGLYFDESKRSILAQHIAERQAATNLPSFAAYYALLTGGNPNQRENERQLLLNNLTINETSFFRNQEHFATLREVALPELLKLRAKDSDRTLRFWSAGCASGEEPYSLAITLLESRLAEGGWQFTVTGSDLDSHALKLAEHGVYGKRSLREVAGETFSRYFTPVPGSSDAKGEASRFQIVPQVKSLVSFSQFNLAAFPYNSYSYGNQDLIFCENVLIYFQSEMVPQVIENLYRCLRPGGYLFLGYAETLWQVPTRLELVSLPNTFCYRRPLSERPERATFAPPERTQPAARLGTGPPGNIFARFKLQTGPLQLPTTDELVKVRGQAAPHLEESERPPSEWIAFGDKLRKENRYNDALAAYQAGLRANPQALEAICGIAQIHFQRGLPDLAVAECLQAIAIDSLYEEAHLLMGSIYASQSGPIARVKAIEAYQKAIYINLNSPAAHYRLAEIYRNATNRGASNRKEQQTTRTAALREYRSTLRCLSPLPDDQQVDGLPASALRRLCELNISALG